MHLTAMQPECVQQYPMWWCKTEPHSAIPAVHIAPLGTRVGMPGKVGWVAVNGLGAGVDWNRHTVVKVNNC